jgi:hypothetical protein
LDVVGNKFLQEIAADTFLGYFAVFQGEGVGDEVEVFGKGFGTVGDTQKFYEAGNDVVIEVCLVCDGNYWLGGRGEGGRGEGGKGAAFKGRGLKIRQ